VRGFWDRFGREKRWTKGGPGIVAGLADSEWLDSRLEVMRSQMLSPAIRRHPAEFATDFRYHPAVIESAWARWRAGKHGVRSLPPRSQTGGAGVSLARAGDAGNIGLASQNFQAKGRPLCRIVLCYNLAESKGQKKNGQARYSTLCYRHGHKNRPYQKLRQKFRPNSKGRKRFPNTQCQKCGNIAICDRHRLDGSKGYSSGNVLILCPSCHQKHHKEAQ
jgi:hypothetical protein